MPDPQTCAQTDPDICHVGQDRNAMATTFEFRVSCAAEFAEKADDALGLAHEKVASLEQELSEFLKNSPVYRLNHALPGERILFSRDGMHLLKESEEIRALSDSAFNHLAKTQGTLESTIGWNEENRLVWRNHSGAWLGFGAIGKGHALDQAARIIEERGFRDYTLSAGGSSLIFSGFSAPGVPWSWGWSWKKNALGENLGLPLSHLTGGKIALGISGLHEKGNHILSRNALAEKPRSALVSHHSATYADGLSTALFVAGWESGMGFLAAAQTDSAAVIDHQEIPRWTSGFQRLFGALAVAASTGVFFFSTLHSAFADETVDLSDMGANAFTPYVNERHEGWAILPLAALLLVTAHLMKSKTKKGQK